MDDGILEFSFSDNTRNAYIGGCHKWMLELEFSILFRRN